MRLWNWNFKPQSQSHLVRWDYPYRFGCKQMSLKLNLQYARPKRSQSSKRRMKIYLFIRTHIRGTHTWARTGRNLQISALTRFSWTDSPKRFDDNNDSEHIIWIVCHHKGRMESHCSEAHDPRTLGIESLTCTHTHTRADVQHKRYVENAEWFDGYANCSKYIFFMISSSHTWCTEMWLASACWQ